MLPPSRLRSLTELLFFLTLLTLLKNGSRFRLFGLILFLYSHLVILQRIFQLKQNFSRQSTRSGSRIWSAHSRRKMSSNAARTNYSSHLSAKCRWTSRSAKSSSTLILNKREVSSPVSTSVLMLTCLRFFPKALTLTQSKMTLKNFSTLSTELLLMSKTVNSLYRSIKSSQAPKKTSLLTRESRLKVTSKTGLPSWKKRCKSPWRRFVRVVLRTARACH